ncbi:uncharacterized protein LOC114516215 [Dendronephthya gigantea]|uniref:uncharacterized protein LOC114516215 n=1 Tax=Dendronephthya gigantea TaxID=151771 RepID=UPI00106AB230|nr:uncharacterized protein LOC114516215 [Dendronephthya gigantea]XP_028391430.1 uncharacterized protein LOC114516215 [Dendronephthya gigantea]XP_028391431.1 uncharacterized protein LOC114516215 [Dendronephthya gigantea]
MKTPDMYPLYFVVIFLTFAWSLPERWEAENCPQECTCLLEGILRTVYCDIENTQQLRAVPSNFPADAQRITLKGNRIAIISAEAFENLRDLRYLNIASNELQSLPQNIFVGLTSLESLNLSRNKLRRLPSGLLNGLNSLRELYLDGNVLENLPKDFFKGLTSLRRLYLDSNKLYTLSHRLFGLRDEQFNTSSSPSNNYTSLVELLLDHNGIAQVKHDSFSKMSDLERLKLNNNNITTLPEGIFRDLKSLRLLSIYKNPFQCTCSLKWLKHWIIRNTKNVFIFNRQLIQCDGPARLHGRGLLKVRDSEFGCENEWTEWSDWNNCSGACNHGRQSRIRECKTGLCEGRRFESRRCSLNRCGPEWSPWSVWTPCSASCFTFGFQTRSRSTHCGIQTPCQRQIESEVRTCARRPCLLYTEWTSWSKCDALCGHGTRVRTRECTAPHSGLVCPGANIETQDCKITECAEWTEWGTWSVCSRNCSGGEQTRTRDCVKVHGSQQECPGNNTELRDCNTKPCPVNGGWSPWQPWGSCSKTCGFGYNTRQRKCSNPTPQHGGAECLGLKSEVDICISKICKDTNEFTQWSEWSQCSSQCGGGFQSRRRSCKRQDPKTGVDMCLGNNKEYRYCEGEECEGGWGEWTPWTRCMGKCYQGNMFRWRFCGDEIGRSGYKCNNKTFDIQNRTCRPLSCNAQPIWSGWSGWSSCSLSCSGGVKRRWRYCLTKILGKPCPGNLESKAVCNTEPCPINGGWSSWSNWSECDQPCDGGMRQRNRSCTEPKPQYNGQSCVGDTTNIEICNKHRCIDDIQNDKGKPPEEVKRPKGPIILGEFANCSNPEMPKNGKYTIKKQRDAHKFLLYKCNDYYRNRAHSTIRFCGDDGTWSGEPADCVPDCGEVKENKTKRRMVEKEKIIRSLSDSWPWQVAIFKPMEVTVKCGGSLIGDQWVLTAAHCVLDPDTKEHFQRMKVKLGTYNSEHDENSRGVQEIYVNKTVHNHHYNWINHSSDIAILKLEKKVSITKYVHPVCLPKTRRRKRLTRPRQTGVFVGWGGNQDSNLRQITLPVVGLKECKKAYQENRYAVTNKMLCAGFQKRGRGFQEKDSGGGFVFLEEGKRKNRWVLGGIASWRHPKSIKYSVFTDVTKHINWIVNTISDLS